VQTEAFDPIVGVATVTGITNVMPALTTGIPLEFSATDDTGKSAQTFEIN
jgi:hypothetical protein